MAAPLSIIIVNFRATKLIVDCLRSLFRFNDPGLFEVIVVDNDPKDEGMKMILKEFPGVKWLDMPYNAGFGRANNAGMRVAQGKCFLLLNPDTISIDDSISQCYINLNDSSCVAAGIQLLDAKGSPQISGSFFVKGGLNHILPIPYWGELVRWIGYRTQNSAPHVHEAGTVEEVDWISGAFLMVKAEAVDQAGMMDEDFFLYAEEVEWCSRLKGIGKLCIFGDLHIIHLEGGSINTEQLIEEKGYYNLSDKKGLQLMVSNHLRVRKQYGAGWFLFLLLNYTWGLFFFWICSSLHRLFTLRNPFGDWKNIKGFASNLGRLWALAPKIIRNKPHFYKMF
jgi:GT2 family glycosyltransferase